MAGYDYDLFVIGAGSGGVRAGRLAAASGALVAVAEEYRVGGTCVIRGCVPKKFMVYASEFSSAFKAAKGFGWTIGETSFDWETFLEAKDIEIARLSGIYVTNLENAGADIILSRAELKAPTQSGFRPRTAPSPPTRSSSPPAAGPPSHRTSRVSSSPSPPTRRSTCRNYRSASWWSAAATSPWNLPVSSMGWVWKPRCFIVDPTSCAASTTTCART